ncbi:MAG: acyltransferase [Clostridia bacterium]|nr:acyltransferase [Clostridia bacterium]
MPKSDRRSLPSPRYAAAGDFMRVFCAFMIGWYHIWQQSWLTPTLRLGGFTLSFYPWVRAGYMFVDLMLLLSGFLLYLPWACGRPPGTGDYLRRRAARILPGYWLALAVMLAFAVTAPDFDRPALLARDLGAHLAFVHNLFRFSYTQTRLNAVLWTLAVEVQFYLLLPALAPLFSRRPLLCWAAMTGIALSFRLLWTAPMSDTTMFVNRLPNMLDLYANGMLAAHLYARLARRKDHRALIAALGTLLCALGAWGVLHIVRAQATAYGDYASLRLGQLTRRWPLGACGAAFLLGGSLGFAPLRRALSNRVLRFLGGASYSFYIWHQWLAVRLKQWRIPPYRAATEPNQAWEMPWQLHYTLLCFAAALLLAVLIHQFVEKPAARRMSRLWKKEE